MYGLINQAIEDLALELGGPALWRALKEQAEVGVQAFVGMDTYPDEVTYRLVAAASGTLQIPPAELLEAFGRHWILFTGRRGYGAIFETMGRNLPEFLDNLDAMHTRLSLSKPELRPPSFVCERLDDSHVALQYWSERQGLAPMVRGLLLGLGELFGVAVTVTHTLSRDSGADHDEFLVAHPPMEASLRSAI